MSERSCASTERTRTRPRELRARIDALLRRTSHPAQVSPSHSAEPDPGAGVGDLEVDTARRTVRLDGELVRLTRTEFDVLAALYSARGRTVAKGDLAALLWPDQYRYGGGRVAEADHRTVEVHVANVRHKLGDRPTSPRFIHTVRGLGYRFDGV